MKYKLFPYLFMNVPTSVLIRRRKLQDQRIKAALERRSDGPPQPAKSNRYPESKSHGPRGQDMLD